MANYSIGRFGGWTYAHSDRRIDEAPELAERLWEGRVFWQCSLNPWSLEPGKWAEKLDYNGSSGVNFDINDDKCDPFTIVSFDCARGVYGRQ